MQFKKKFRNIFLQRYLPDSYTAHPVEALIHGIKTLQQPPSIRLTTKHQNKNGRIQVTVEEGFVWSIDGACRSRETQY